MMNQISVRFIENLLRTVLVTLNMSLLIHVVVWIISFNDFLKLIQ